MSHISVLSHEVLEHLNIQPTDTVLDGTVGGAGHSVLMAEQLSAGGHLICCDLDQTALDAAVPLLADVRDRGVQVSMYHGSFADIGESDEYNNVKYDKILLDLGWSSNQFENPDRGFSFMHDGPLDMRLSFPGTGTTARDILHNSTESELIELLETFGEEPHAKKIAAAIIHERIHGTLETTHDLARTVESVVGRRGKTHPATQTFQALRIAVNHEIDAIVRGIPILLDHLNTGGRMSVITFHSLEDRLVKRILSDHVTTEKFRLINKHVVVPSRSEFVRNPRSRSAKLRTIERI